MCVMCGEMSSRRGEYVTAATVMLVPNADVLLALEAGRRSG